MDPFLQVPDSFFEVICRTGFSRNLHFSERHRPERFFPKDTCLPDFLSFLKYAWQPLYKDMYHIDPSLQVPGSSFEDIYP